MNVLMFDPAQKSETDDPVGQAIAAFTSSAEVLYQLAIVSENRDRMANEKDFEIVRHGMTQAQLVASLIETRMLVNTEVA